MEEQRLAGGALRGAPHPPEGGRLPDARLAERGRRRRPGGLAAAEPDRREEIDNLGGWLTTVVARVCLNMLRSRESRREQALGPRVPEPIVDPRGRHGPRARGAARRLGRARAARRPRDAEPRRAAGVRPSRRLRRPVRRDRADRRSLAGGGPAAGQPRAPPGARRAGARRRPRGPAGGGRRLLRRRSRGRLRAARRGARPRRRRCTPIAARSRRARRSSSVAPRPSPGKRAAVLAADLVVRPALVNGAPGVVTIRDGEPFSVGGASPSGAGRSSRSTSSPTPSASASST